MSEVVVEPRQNILSIKLWRKQRERERSLKKKEQSLNRWCCEEVGDEQKSFPKPQIINEKKRERERERERDRHTDRERERERVSEREREINVKQRMKFKQMMS